MVEMMVELMAGKTVYYLAGMSVDMKVEWMAESKVE